MPIKVTCSNCGGVLHAPDDSAGKRGRCPTCGTVLTITPDAAGPAAPVFGAPRPTDASPAQINNPWGSLPGGPEDSHQGVQVSSKPAFPVPASQMPGGRAGMPIPPQPQPEPVAPSHESRVPPDPRKFPPAANDPFAKPARPKSADEETTKKWWKVRRGLGWVSAGVFFCLLGTLAYCAIPILEQFGVKLPEKSPGFLKVDNYSQTEEIRLFATLGPIVLGLLCIWFGRVGVAASPASGFARSPSVWCSIATMLALGGLIAYLVMAGLAVKDGLIPQFTPNPALPTPRASLAEKGTQWLSGLVMNQTEAPGQIQSVGLTLCVVFGLLAEVWFVATLGRFAASLQSERAAGRVNRFVVLVGLLFALKVLAMMLIFVTFPNWANTNIWEKWNTLADKWKPVVCYGSIAVGGLLLAVLYWRMIGGVRGAISENYDS